jgi:hypothetical protein
MTEIHTIYEPTPEVICWLHINGDRVLAGSYCPATSVSDIISALLQYNQSRIKQSTDDAVQASSQAGKKLCVHC